MIKKFLLGVCAFSLLSLWMYQANAAVPPVIENGKPAPLFELSDELGNKVKLADFKGKLVVLEWTNPDCPFVKRHYASNTMETLSAKLAAQEVTWLTINSSKHANQDSNKAWKASEGFAYPVLDDNTGAVGKLYGAKTTPHMFVIDKEGVLRYQGAIDSDSSGDEKLATNYVAQAVQELIAGVAVSQPQTKPYGCSVKYRS
jgi:peroxiredoxin